MIKQALTQFHADKAKAVFEKHIKGYIPGLDHMCVSISYKKYQDTIEETKLLMLSPIAKIEDHYYNKSGFAQYDHGLSERLYKKYILYPWEDGTFGSQKLKIDSFKKDIYGLHSGHFLSIPHDNDIYLIFGIASYNPNPWVQESFFKNIPKLIEAANFYYETLKSIFDTHENIIIRPKNNAQNEIIKNYNFEEDEENFGNIIYLNKYKKTRLIHRNLL